MPDVVIVGAGSAGAVLAARLSEDASRSVLLLEAGPDNRAAATPPGIASANFFAAFGEPGRMWPNLTATRAAGSSPSFYARGRGVGGSSAVNAMAALRGTPDDYDRWVDELGCPGWGWTEMLAAFCALEDDVDYGGDGYHGQGGPTPLARTPYDALPPLDRALRAALADLGYPECDDWHAPDATGVSRAALTLRDGRRVSTNEAYLEPARVRRNFSVRGDAHVDRVVLDGRRATGVRLACGEVIDAPVVIVSAGAIHSPAILLRSGIGPGTGLPVGRNLADHAATAGFEFALRPVGRMTSTAAPVVCSGLRYSSELADAGPNDMQMLWFGATGPTDDGLRTGRMFGAVMRVFSRGTVRLGSDDPLVDPVVDFNTLSDERDRVRLHDVVRRMLDVVRHPAISAITDNVTAGTEPIANLGSDADIDAWVLANVNDYVHAAGSCAMGSVVDTECRVIGYGGLRVCDASVMPDLPRANTHLTTVAIAERVAQMMTGV